MRQAHRRYPKGKGYTESGLLVSTPKPVQTCILACPAGKTRDRMLKADLRAGCATVRLDALSMEFGFPADKRPWLAANAW